MKESWVLAFHPCQGAEAECLWQNTCIAPWFGELGHAEDKLFTAFGHSVSADPKFWASDLNDELPKLATFGDGFVPFLNTPCPWLCSRVIQHPGAVATDLPSESTEVVKGE